MIDFRSKIVTAAAAAAFMLGTLANPAFAGSEMNMSVNTSTSTEVNSSTTENNWVFGGDRNFNGFFGQFFGRKLRANMDGAQEIPGPGDPDGTGEGRVKLKKENEICVDLKVKYIEPATAAHIHHAPRGSAGAVVVSLPVPDAEGEAEGCVGISSTLHKAIKDNPQDYYINIHNSPYPNGAIRGQLSR